MLMTGLCPDTTDHHYHLVHNVLKSGGPMYIEHFLVQPLVVTDINFVTSTSEEVGNVVRTTYKSSPLALSFRGKTANTSS
jgi:hypothetical protein